jgi:hypothetical protein
MTMKMIVSILIISSLISERNPTRSSENFQRNKVQRIYTSELGVKEKSNHNDGPRVEEYLHAVGLRKGDPWCAAFVCWVFDRAGVANPHTGWAPDLFPKAKVIWQRKMVIQTGGKLRKADKPAIPKPGDVFGIWFPEKGRIAHAGFVERWEQTWVITVEGNTNEAGSREGDGVWRKRRLVGSVWKVADFIGL